MMVKRMRQMRSAGYTLAELMICIAILVVLGLFGGLAWILIHFLIKFW